MAEPRKLEGEARKEFVKQLQREYYDGASLRELARRHDVSYGFVQRSLHEANTTMRPRGGPRGHWGKAQR